MNKIVNINLGGYPFTIDDDAYESLSRYLKTIDRHFSKSEGHDDIIFDIESRMAELLKENLPSGGIVTQKHVDEIIAIMGTPESFGAETDFEESSSAHQTSGATHNRKRLFRNPEDKYLGGVSSGLAAFFGVENPNWVRLLFVILASMGMGVFVYILLWVFVPTAKTSSDFLSMRGEPINITTISKSVENELSDIKNKISDLGNEFKNMKFL